MFKNAKVGDKVVSKEYGRGSIVAIVDDRNYPILVDFLEYQHQYTMEGSYWGTWSSNYGTDLAKNIVPLIPCKLGSPDARKIVSMLANIYRKDRGGHYIAASYKGITGSMDDYDQGRLDGQLEAYNEAYQQAKRLLGETNENS